MKTAKGKSVHTVNLKDNLYIARKLTISGTVYLLDHDFGSPDDHLLATVPTKTLYLTDDSIQEALSFSTCVDDEVRAELYAKAQLLSNGDIRVNGDLLLFEGASCGTSDLDGKYSFNFIVPADKTKPLVHRLWNEDEGNDYIDLDLNFGNFAA